MYKYLYFFLHCKLCFHSKQETVVSNAYLSHLTVVVQVQVGLERLPRERGQLDEVLYGLIRFINYILQSDTVNS